MPSLIRYACLHPLIFLSLCRSRAVQQSQEAAPCNSLDLTILYYRFLTLLPRLYRAQAASQSCDMHPSVFSYPVIQTEPDSLSLVAMHQLEPSSCIHLICARELPHIFKGHQLLLSPASSSLRLPRIRESAHTHSEQCVRSCSICAHTHLRGGVRKGIVSLC